MILFLKQGVVNDMALRFFINFNLFVLSFFCKEASMSIVSEHKNNVKVLDCTLRDGGYVNDWNFKSDGITSLVDNLNRSGIKYIELGFLQSKVFSAEYSLFTEIDAVKGFCVESLQSILTLMINFGEYPISKIPPAFSNKIALRVAFKKFQLKEALLFCRQLVDKGYDVFVNPMHTNTYSVSDLQKLVSEVNSFKPKALTIVDTNGAMKECEVLSYFGVISGLLHPSISLGFHSHNNLQLSLSNAKCLINVHSDRELIIDSTLMGMGRGAGNLCTEVFLQYMNENYDTNYDMNFIYNVIDKVISPIYKRNPWGHSLYYYLAAVNNCHPNYAKYLMSCSNVPLNRAKEIFLTMPIDKKTLFDEMFIKDLVALNYSNT